ncbi:spore coat protein YutH [Alteribacillus persepolensis]|uniref:Spore coat protein YutH n=1 Tax=Alteribacillus persepolensis TaxID=568899 RepID=A0A1G8DXH7_9BACI|nr:spore coat protein YutH [Alteribacillus persepolensis]SDH62446.1 spore coat protein YutH [Alteribacillus persepolensis]
MMERNVYDHYGLYMREAFQAGAYAGFYTDHAAYLLVPDVMQKSDDWKEKLDWAAHLKWCGDDTIAEFVAPYTRGYSVPVDGEKQLLFQIPAKPVREHDPVSDGEALFRFHQLGKRLFPSSAVQPFSQRWCEWWETRLGQLENWYANVRKKASYSDMDKWFLHTFPYYIGRTENAIQWVKETAWEMGAGEEPGCVSHFCFTPNTWITIAENNASVKLPSDWLYDHPSRDVAEWLRYVLTDGDTKAASQFLSDYQHEYELSPLACQLVFGRLLFPYYFMERVEQTYLRETTSEYDQALADLQAMWEKEPEHIEKLAVIANTSLSCGKDLPEWFITSLS